MSKKTTVTLIAFLAVVLSLNGQTARQFTATCDSLQTLLKERSGVSSIVKLSKVSKAGNSLDLFFTKTLGDYPWREADITWFKDTFARLSPESCSNLSVRNMYVDGNPISKYVIPAPGNDGKPSCSLFRTSHDPRPRHPFVERADKMDFPKGLDGRNIALWQSHGRYYEEKTDRWEWQRAPVFQTVEDMYTQSYVLPFLIPMLENAGAYVMTPRERDTQVNEIIMDNDFAFSQGRGEGVRLEGSYSENGRWKDAGVGFADAKAVYTGLDNPFRMGTARMVSCDDKDASATWTPDIPEQGKYSVYVSYKSLPKSTTCAHYTVRHRGGDTEFYVNQTIGGGTWIYLGTFEFEKGREGRVTLDSVIPEGRSVPGNAVLTADAVRIGGGMGKIARGPKNSPVSSYTTSGMPSFTEGAFYWMQWAGADSTLLTLQDNDYTSDYADRGAWVCWMSGSSRTNPEQEGLGIPVDLSFAFHTDAGTTPNDSIIGTLSIYTLMAENSDLLPNGEKRLQGRMLADYAQTQIVNDIRASYEPNWSRRGLWDRSYSESRTPSSPAMLLELLSHQNFADMKYGLDPSFRFTVSRAIYKGMLKYLSDRYGCEYAVQPLPVNSFAVDFKGSPTTTPKVRLSWKPTLDSLESTARPSGYIVYTKIDDGAFDEGTVVKSGALSLDRNISAGHVYSYKVVAFNQGGVSFPSEVLSVGVPENAKKGKSVLVVNNFTRVAPPAWFDTETYAGFNNELDGGVAYMEEINFIGKQYQFRRELPWLDDDNPGFGASYTDHAGKKVLGNTFDYTAIHGKAIMNAGYAYHSASVAAFESEPSLYEDDFAIDFLCGKQVTTKVGSGAVPAKYQVFTRKSQKALTDCASKGKGIMVTGANIGTDVWDMVYPLETDSLYRADTKAFVNKILGYKWLTNYATRSGSVNCVKGKDFTDPGALSYHNEENDAIYQVEQADGLLPCDTKGWGALRYGDTNITAAVCFKSVNHRTFCAGFPFETIKEDKGRDALMRSVLSFLDYK